MAVTKDSEHTAVKRFLSCCDIVGSNFNLLSWWIDFHTPEKLLLHQELWIAQRVQELAT